MVILLDIDGVMVPANSWKRPEFLSDRFPVFSPKSVEALQKVISATGADLLLTTSHKNNYTVEQWHEIFSARGLDVHKINRLSNSGSNRKEEILNWYKSKKNALINFVIIDDDKLLNDLPGNIKANLVLTSPSIGLTDELANNAIAILREKARSVA
jgi:hypothetical protein